MPRMLAAVLLLAGAVRAFAAVPPSADAGTWFADALRARDARAFEKELVPGATARAWREVQALFARNDCISAELVSSRIESITADAAVVRVQLRAGAISNAASHQHVDLPSRWRLDLRRQPDGSWRIDSAMTEEREVALCMVNAASLEETDEIYATAATDPIATVGAYSYEASELDRLSRAAIHLPHSVALARETGSVRVLADNLELQASTYAIGSIPGALALSEEALEVARTRGGPYDLAGAYFNLGVVHLLEGRNAEALQPLHEAAAMIDATPDPIVSLKALRMHIYVLDRLGRTLDILRETDELAELSRRYQWLEGEEVAAFEKAGVLQTLGNLDASIETLKQAAELAREAGNTDHTAFAYYNASGIYQLQGRLDLAMSGVRRSIELWPAHSQELLRMYEQLASLQIEAGDLASAAKTLRTTEPLAREIGTDKLASGALLKTRSSLLLHRSRPAEALDAARASIELLHALEGSEERMYYADALTTAGRALRALGRRTEAIEMFRNAVDVVETQRRHAPDLEQARIVLLQFQLAPYFELAELLAMREDTTAAALRVAEQMKARALLDASARSGGDFSAELSADERTKENELETRVEELNRALYRRRSSRERSEQQQADLDAARIELAGYRSELRLKHPHVAERDVVIPAKLPLRDRDAIEFVVGDKRTLAFLVPAAGSGRPIRVVPIAIGRAALQRRVDRYASALAHRSFAYRADARALYETLLQPLGAFASARTPLCIIPDGPLWRLPFQTLIAPSGKHLAEQRPVSFAPSLAILHTERSRKPGASALLAFGNPRVSGTARQTVRSATSGDLAGPLPEAEEEVRAIATLYRGATLFTGAAATESAFKREAPNYRILHLATHGFVVSGAPLYSSLLLSDDGVNDGVLEAREVADLQLGADLAILSACDTASGKISAGEGVVGLAWAFLAAGCPTTVVSQWTADSAATSRLMIEFHRHLRAGHTPAEALRLSQRSLMRSRTYWHPYYWAPFIVLGRDAATR